MEAGHAPPGDRRGGPEGARRVVLGGRRVPRWSLYQRDLLGHVGRDVEPELPACGVDALAGDALTAKTVSAQYLSW